MPKHRTWMKDQKKKTFNGKIYRVTEHKFSYLYTVLLKLKWSNHFFSHDRLQIIKKFPTLYYEVTH